MSKNGQNKVKKPNALLYLVFYLLMYPVIKVLFHLKVDRRHYNPSKGPFIMVSNHQSFMDFLLTMLTIYPHRLNAVAAQKFFFYRPLDTLMPIMGAIPKNLFDPDIRAVKSMMEVIKRGDKLLLFPEGRCTTHGPYMGMHKATGKLLKKLNVPVFSCCIEGAYTCMPFWRKGFRRGQVRVTLADLFTAQDTQTFSVDEINSKIDARLCGVDLISSSSQSKTSKPLRLFKAKRLLEGLENIIYYCPKCQQEFTLKTEGNTIFCTSCKNTATMDCSADLIPNEGSVVPKTVADWYKEQAMYEMQFLHMDMEPISTEVVVRMPLHAGEGLEECGQGLLSLDCKGWHYNGELLGESVQMFFPIETVPAIPFDPNDDFQIYARGSFYMFTPKGNAQACAKYATIGECAYWRFASTIQMTKGYDSGFCA